MYYKRYIEEDGYYVEYIPENELIQWLEDEATEEAEEILRGEENCLDYDIRFDEIVEDLFLKKWDTCYVM